MKTTVTLFALAGIFALGLSQVGNAATLTGFETDEGFILGSRSTSAGSPARSWDLAASTTAGRTTISNAQAQSGAQSLSMLGGAAAEHVIQTLATDSGSNNSFSYSFLSPEAAYGYQATTSWVYINLYNQTTQANAGSVQLKTRYGTSAGGAFQIQYSTWDAGGTHSLATLSIPQASMNFSVWNTITLTLDFAADTYSVRLNGDPVLSNILLGSDATKSATTIGGSWLVSGNASTSTPGVYASVYYDNITVVPEPSGLKTAASGTLLLGGWFFLKRLKSRRTVASR